MTNNMTNKHTYIQEVKKEFDNYFSGYIDIIEMDKEDTWSFIETLITNTLTARDKEVEEIIEEKLEVVSNCPLYGDFQRGERSSLKYVLSALNNKKDEK